METEELRKQLEEQLEYIKQRIQILDMLEERLHKMRGLAQTAVDNDLTPAEIEAVNYEIKILEDQINLLSLDENLQS